jgi:hypothetical protein
MSQGRKARLWQSLSETDAGSAWSETPYMHGNTLRGSRESPWLPATRDGQAGRIGKSEDTSR